MQNTLNYLFKSQLESKPHGRNEFLQTKFDYANNLYHKDLKGHFSCVNAIEFSNRESNFLISGGDDKRVLLWDINNDILSTKYNPVSMRAQHNSNIFTLAWDNENQRIFSGGNDHQVIVHDVTTREICDIFLHDNSVLSLSVHPKQSQIFATACENGIISLYDLRLSNTDPIILSSSRSSSSGGSFHSCCFNPIENNLLAIGNEISGLSLIDIRMKNTVLKYKATSSKTSTTEEKQNIMNVQFSSDGKRLAALRSKLRPVIYELNNPYPKFLFDHEDYKNSCTLKSCCFGGDKDQYFISGSDDFSVFVWKIPFNEKSEITEDENSSYLISDIHLKLQSHRSIVNQCRYNKQYHLLASSGIEKLIKIWSPYKLPTTDGGGLLGKQDEYAPKRKLFSNRSISSREDPSDLPVVLFDLNNNSSLNEESIEEDSAMIAFFDLQIKRQRRLEDYLTRRHSINNSLSSLSSSYDSSNDSSDSDKESNESDETSDSNSDNNSISESCSETSTNTSFSRSTNSSWKRLNKKKNNCVEFSSSSSTNSSSEETEVSSDDLNIKSTSCNKKNKNVSLRNRLRNLKHRKSLNLTQESDYINVLDSLNVKQSTDNENEEISKNAGNSSSNNSLCTIELAQKSSGQCFSGINHASDDILLDDETSQKNPISPRSYPCDLKSLNEKKRKIQEDLDENDQDTDNKNDKIKVTNNDYSSCEDSEISFKKTRLNQKSSHQSKSRRNYRNKNPD